MKANIISSFNHFMSNGGWNRDSARIIFGNDKGGELFGRWAHYTKYMVVDAANTKFFDSLTTEEQEILCEYATAA